MMPFWVTSNYVVVVLLVLISHNSVFPLKCFWCRSNYSWKDCDKYKTQMLCDSQSNTCFTAHTVTQFGNGQQLHHFIRDCFHTTSCTQEHCSKSAHKNASSSCQFYCCNTTLCNTDVTPWARDKGYVLQYITTQGNSDGVVIKTSIFSVVMVLLVTIATLKYVVMEIYL